MNTLIVHPAVVTSLRCYLFRHGVDKCDVEDTIAEVQARALQGIEGRKAPADVAGWQAFLITIARNCLADGARQAKTVDKHDDGPCENPDDYAPFLPSGTQRDPIDRKRQFAVLVDMFKKGEMPDRGNEILRGSPTACPSRGSHASSA